MAKTLSEYADWLEERKLIWPKVPPMTPPKATPYLKPLTGIRAVTWSVYGTLLRISDGELLFDHPQELRMQVAMEKTIHEFNMWHSMPRKPGEPWKQLYEKYADLLEQRRMTGTRSSPGDFPEVDCRDIWKTVVKRLQAKEYQYDRSLYGDEDELSEKIAFFFHSSLQGTEPSPHAARALLAVNDAGLVQTLLGDAQCFTLIQLLRALRSQSTLPPPGDLFAFEYLSLSFQEEVRTPSPSLYRNCLRRFHAEGISPDQVLHIGCRLKDDVAVAKSLGMRTALYAADAMALRATKEEIADSELRPDRLLTDLAQVRDVLAIG